MLTTAIHTDKSDATIQEMYRMVLTGFRRKGQLTNIPGIKMSFVYSIYAHRFCLSRQFTSVICYPSCRWGWSSWRNFCSGRPCWKVAGPWYCPKIAPKWPRFHPFSQCPLSWWLLEKTAHVVAETELQCMHHTHVLDSEILFCPGHNFPWQELNIICPAW